MFDIILDPSRDGCEIWYRNYVSSIKGTIEDVCKNLFKRITYIIYERDGTYRCFQCKSIGLDVTGYGLAYKDCLERMGIEIEEIKPKHVGVFLPELNDEGLEINSKC